MGLNWLQFRFYGIRTKILAFRPADSSKKETNLFEIFLIFKSFEKLTPNVGRDIKNTGYAI